jgi:hypothetical protein
VVEKVPSSGDGRVYNIGGDDGSVFRREPSGPCVLQTGNDVPIASVPETARLESSGFS